MFGILGQLEWEFLRKKRKGNGLILLYKGLTGDAEVPADDLVSNVTCRHCRKQHSMAFQIPDACGNSFCIRDI